MKNLKISFLALTLSLLFIGKSTFASFPVKQENKKQENKEFIEKASQNQELNVVVADEKVTTGKEKVDLGKGETKLDEKLILLLLWFFLGGFAAHRWYAGKPAGWNILYILTFGGCGIWAIIDLINILKGDF